jgi:hypothetical protein
MARTLGGAPASAFDTLVVARGVRCRRRYPRKAPPVSAVPALDLPTPVADAAPAREPLSYRVAPGSTGLAASVVKGGMDSLRKRVTHEVPAPLVGVAFRRVGDDLLLLDLSTGEQWPAR